MLNLLGKKKAKAAVPMPHANTPIKTSYDSVPIPIPSDFLSPTNLPTDAKPMEVNHIDFANTAVPEYTGLYAVVLDNVLSASECDQLIKLAEASVPPTEGTFGAAAGGSERDPWQPALVNIGAGWEVLQADYRNSDRIIWDQEEVTDRLWRRIEAGAPEVAKGLAEVAHGNEVLGGFKWGAESKWTFKGLNRRMRFLRYGKGQFFKGHCDAPYEVQGVAPERRIKTIFTLHLYLNDSVDGIKGVKGVKGEPKPELVGGSTPFLSNDEKRRVDVHPMAGRVLIFQHRRLLHSGDDVVKGIKYTMRSDILYELVLKEQEGEVEL